MRDDIKNVNTIYNAFSIPREVRDIISTVAQDMIGVVKLIEADLDAYHCWDTSMEQHMEEYAHGIRRILGMQMEVEIYEKSEVHWLRKRVYTIYIRSYAQLDSDATVMKYFKYTITHDEVGPIEYKRTIEFEELPGIPDIPHTGENDEEGFVFKRSAKCLLPLKFIPYIIEAIEDLRHERKENFYISSFECSWTHMEDPFPFIYEEVDDNDKGPGNDSEH